MKVLRRAVFFIFSLFSLFLLLLFSGLAFAEDSVAPMMKASVNLRDQASLQRGAKLFINYCAGCHSLGFLRYERLAKDLGIVNENGKVDAELVKKNLIFTGAKISDPIMSAMPAEAATRWFGKPPPDLSLEARVRGADWLYTYLHSFYQENTAPWGSNNWLLKDVAMPNVLYPLQGEQIPVYKAGTKVMESLVLVKEGSLTPEEYDQAMNDLVNFMVYAAEPVAVYRQHLGWWVLAFLLVLLIPVYLLKREYWKDVH